MGSVVNSHPMKRFTYAAVLGLGFVTGCGEVQVSNVDSGTGTPDSSTAIDANISEIIEATIAELQDGTVPTSTRVVVTDVVVTAISYNRRNYWVQNQGAASAFNGVFVFRGQGQPLLPKEFAVGKVLSLEGTVVEFNGELTELVDTIVLRDDGATGIVSPLSGISVTELATEEQYEGILVDISNVLITTAPTTGCNEFCTFEFRDEAGLMLASDMIFRHESIRLGECYDIQGIMHFSPMNSKIEILPLSDGLTAKNSSDCMF